MGARKKVYAICPCCKAEKHRTEMRKAIEEKGILYKSEYKKMKELKIDLYNSFIDSNYDWACDDCLNNKKAIPGNPQNQSYCWNPNYAYFDVTKKCQHCGDKFVFTKKEKKYWMETLKFWVDSSPDNCETCRKTVRILKVQNKTLSKILINGNDDLLATDLKKVIDIYREWGKLEKAKFYESILKKRRD